MIILINEVERKPNVTGESLTFRYDETKIHVNYKLLSLKTLLKPRRIYKTSAYQMSAFLLSNL